MASKHEEQARQESTNQKMLLEWIQQRVAHIHSRVTLFDVLRKNGVELEYEDRPSQFSCPFHGKDTKPSARSYPEDASSPSHAWCFVCQERWDAISIWKKFSGPEKKFTRILTEIELSFGLDQPPQPDALKFLTSEPEVQVDDLAQFHKLEMACENRLLAARKVYDLKGYLSAASLLERVSTRVVDRRMPVSEGEQRLRILLENIGKKLRACLAG